MEHGGRRKKLVMTVRMLEEGSPFLRRTCAECLQWMWTDDGKIEGVNLERKTKKQYVSLKVLQADGAKPWPRPLGVVTPCFKCPKIDDDAPDKSYHYAMEPSERSYETIRHHDQCKAVGQFPIDQRTGEVDPIVRRNAELIQSVREAYRRAEQKQLLMQMTMLKGMT